MHAKFSGPKTETVTITHGEESIDFTLTALPVSFGVYVTRVFPEPIEYINGKPSDKPAPGAAEWSDLRFYILLAKSLEPSDVLESSRSGTDRAAWEKYARAVRDEFQAAGLTDGDVMALIKAMNRVSYEIEEAAEGDPGNA